MKVKELETLVAEKYEKYNRLLWYARSKPEHIKIEGVKEAKERVEREFAEEVAALEGEHSDWQHGFHSGCCAAFSYVLTCLDRRLGLEVAEEEFPMLDS
jgi:hypothetical protein